MPMNGWKPIDTAPFDVEILVACYPSGQKYRCVAKRLYGGDFVQIIGARRVHPKYWRGVPRFPGERPKNKLRHIAGLGAAASAGICVLKTGPIEVLSNAGSASAEGRSTANNTEAVK